MLQVKIPDDFPKQPPIVRFQQPKVVMDCVNETGYVSLVLISFFYYLIIFLLFRLMLIK